MQQTVKTCPSCNGTGIESQQASTEVNGQIVYYYPSCKTCKGAGKILA